MDFSDHDDGDDELTAPSPAPPSVPGMSSGPFSPPPLAAVPNSAHRAGTSKPEAAGNRRSSGGVRYRECLKNHALGIGGHAVDGCMEFLPAGEDGTLDALRCAACSCHRNFHRKVSGEGGAGESSSSPSAGCGESPYHHRLSPYYRTPAGYLYHHQLMANAAHHYRPPHSVHPAPLALPSTSGGGRDELPGEDPFLPLAPVSVQPLGMGAFLASPYPPPSAAEAGSGSSSGKKRYRTKFTQEQKDKMFAFAERVGWRLQKHDEAAVQQFCEEVCVRRQVFKVWMHNNKHTLGKKP